jgi:hypothetical protein
MSAPKRNLPSLGLASACTAAGMIHARKSAMAANAAVKQAACTKIDDSDFRDGVINAGSSSDHHRKSWNCAVG